MSTEDLNDSEVVLYGADNRVQFTDTTAVPGVGYYYTVTHVGTEQTESDHSPEVFAVTPAEDGANSSPQIDIIAPSQQTWASHPRIVAYLSASAGIDTGSVRVWFDQPLGDPDNGGRVAGEDISDLAYRLEDGVIIIPLGPEYGLPSQTLATMTVEAADLKGTVATNQVPMFVTTVSAQPPVADMKVSQPTMEMGGSQVVDFDASDSTDTDGKIYRWEWYFGDGSTGIGRQVRHAYGAGGTYTVQLLVRDNEGGVSVVTQDVEVEGLPQTCDPEQNQDCDGNGTAGGGGCEVATRKVSTSGVVLLIVLLVRPWRTRRR